MDSSIKSLTITGAAAETVSAKAARRSNAVSRKKRKDQLTEDDDFIEQVKQQVIFPKSSQPVQAPQPIQKIAPAIAPTVISQKPPPIHVPTPQPLQPVQEGASVILKPPKQQRVKLQPKLQSQPTQAKPIHQTRKARRFRISVENLTKRFTRAKKLKDETEKKSTTNIREFLVGKGVIQEKSKAPERMLRSMYSDFMLLKDTAL
jgi:hypothetical protein